MSLVFVIGFVIIHLTSKQMKFLKVEPRSKFLSVAGGVSVAYVFMHLLPELKEYQEEFDETFQGLQFLESHIYIIALLGLSFFMVWNSLQKSRKDMVENQGHIKHHLMFSGSTLALSRSIMQLLDTCSCRESTNRNGGCCCTSLRWAFIL